MKFAHDRQHVEPHRPRPRSTAAVLSGTEMEERNHGVFTEEEWEGLKHELRDERMRPSEKLKRLSWMLALNPQGRKEFPELENPDADHSLLCRAEQDIYHGVPARRQVRHLIEEEQQRYIAGKRWIAFEPSSFFDPVSHACAAVLLYPDYRKKVDYIPYVKNCLMDIFKGSPQQKDYFYDLDDNRLGSFLKHGVNRARLAFNTAVVFPDMQEEIANQDALWATVQQETQAKIDKNIFDRKVLLGLTLLKLMAPRFSLLPVSAEVMHAFEDDVGRKRRTLRRDFLEDRFYLALLKDPDARITRSGELVLTPTPKKIGAAQLLPDRKHV